MIEISKTITTTASPATVLDWFAHFDEHYVQWWPDAHKEYQYTSQTPPQEGTTFRVVQVVKGRQNTIRGVITKMEPGGFAWKMIPLPLMAGSYRYRPLDDGGTEITQTLQYGPPWPILGPALLFVMEAIAVSREDLKKHLAEEMGRLQEALEAEE